jgi:hypothetical protein
MANAAQNVVAIEQPKKELSMSPDAVRRRAKRAADKLMQEAAGNVEVAAPAKVAKPKAKAAVRKLPTAAPIKVSAAQKRTIGQFVAAIASGFLPISHITKQLANRCCGCWLLLHWHLAHRRWQAGHKSGAVTWLRLGALRCCWKVCWCLHITKH